MGLNKILISVFLALDATFSVSSVMAAEINGAGASFPYPIYAKWAESYKVTTGNSLKYQSINRFGRRYQTD